MHGSIGANDTDLFAVTLPAALGAGEELLVSACNTESRRPLSLELLATDATPLAARRGPTARLAVTDLQAGTYFVRLTEPEGATFDTDAYELDLRIGSSP